MREELEQKLAEKYPFMRKGESLAVQHAKGYVGDLYSAFGCDCGDGWYSLLDELCGNIQRIINESETPVEVRVRQIKEKYGTLRFYEDTKGPEDVCKKIWKVISEAESKSEFICEECGNPGTMREEYYVFVRCDECYAKMQEYRNQMLKKLSEAKKLK